MRMHKQQCIPHAQAGALVTMCTQYTNKNEVAIDFSRRQEHE